MKLSLHKLERFKKTIVCSWTEHSEDCEISGASGLGQEHRTKDGGGRGPGEGGKTGGDVSVGMMGGWYQWGFQCNVDNYFVLRVQLLRVLQKRHVFPAMIITVCISRIKQQRKENIEYSVSFNIFSSIIFLYYIQQVN